MPYSIPRLAHIYFQLFDMFVIVIIRILSVDSQILLCEALVSHRHMLLLGIRFTVGLLPELLEGAEEPGFGDAVARHLRV